MDKRESKKDNVIMFPGLEKRLLEKGLDYLKQQKYRDAIKFLEQALDHDPENSDVYFGLVRANYEAGYNRQAKEVVEEMLRCGIGDYIKVIDKYLMILFQLKEYNKVVTTVEALLEEREIPADKYEVFITALKTCKELLYGEAEVEAHESFVEESFEGEREKPELNFFDYKAPNEQLMVAAGLSKVNVRPFFKKIREYTAAEEGQPFLKTMLLNILKEQECFEEIDVRKFGMSRSINTADLPELKDYIENSGVIQLLSGEIESDDPVLFENTQKLVERYFFLLYPFEVPKGLDSAWAAACHFIANEYYGFEDPLESFAEIYNSNIEETEQVLSFIRKLEEISYPII
ncbi:tetratricopeptide repeat protein [Mesobacillus subterraneus]|uniref:tetratricopeptide repeat protein n=1 Tax=Mesobacillus subterraneus TaxID=285983 RepID=UPI001CFF0F6C|nr:tetratricopeptide repeat protein [Mesobacillus subterraneus]WLR56162.1 tetratricopeptide repeat protein [Mesobacillus subterraneus]